MTTAAHDLDTRGRLLDAARALFSERGFEDVTVRDICAAAGANLALVNYYFGDKQGLYREIAEEAVAILRRFNEVATSPPAGSTAEQKLAHFVRVFLRRVLGGEGWEAWVHRIMQQELSRPTEAAALIGREAIAPRIRWLGTVVAELLGCPPTDPSVGQCVASVHGLCLAYARARQVPEAFRQAVPELAATDRLDLDAQIEHVVTFSLAGIQAVGGK